MALEFSDWGLSPDERVKSRKEAMDSYINMAQPATKAQDARERGQLADDVYYQSQDAAQRGMNANPIIAKATQQAAQLLPQQAQRSGEMAYAGAKMKEDILASKQEGAVSDYERATEEYKTKAAENLAARAFEMNYSSKELALSLNGYVADRGLNMLYQDLQAGRVTAAELETLQNNLAMDSLNKKAAMEKELAELDYKLRADIANRDFAAAQARIKAMIERQKEIASEAAKASGISSILSGVAGLASGITAGVLSGSPTFGTAVGKTTKDVTSGLFNVFN